LYTFSQGAKEEIWVLPGNIEISNISSMPTILPVNNGIGTGYVEDKLLYTVSSASITDSEGNLLFYSDGMSIFDKEHNFMPNGKDLSGHGFLYQGVLIVPTLEEGRYYVITAGNYPSSITSPDGGDRLHELSYSIIDMTLNGDLGDILPGKKNLKLNDAWHKGMVAIPGGCEDTWLVTGTTSTINVYRMDVNGIEKHGVYNRSQSTRYLDDVVLKVSPNRDKIAVVNFLGRERYIELHTFDYITGEVSEQGLLHDAQAYIGGVTFDYNNNLYAYLYVDGTFGISKFNCNSNNISEIQSSAQRLVEAPKSEVWDMKLVSDSLILLQNTSYIGGLISGEGESQIYIDSLFDYPNGAFFSNHFPSQSFCPKMDATDLITGLPKDTSLCPDENLEFDISTLESFDLFLDGVEIERNITINEAGEYVIELYDEGCLRMDTLLIEERENCECNLYVPNAYSPNEDGIHDQFEISTNCVLSEYSFSIYDRWGGEMFHSDDDNTSWNGTAKGQKCQPGVYHYVLSYSFLEAAKIYSTTGTITLIR